jgi:hypothetical protein
MFNPTDQMLVPLVILRPALDPSEAPSSPVRARSTRRTVRRPRPNVVRLIPGVTRLPIGYSPR